MTIEFFEKFGEVAPRVRPFERSNEGFVVPLKRQQPVLNGGQGPKVVRGDDLALDDGEIDLDLIEPAGVHRAKNQHEIGVPALQPFDRAWTAMRGSVVDNPENAVGLAIGRDAPDLPHTPAERLDAGLALAAAKQARPVYIPRREIRPRALAFVLVLNPHRLVRARRCGRMTSASRLNAGLLIGGDHVVVRRQRLAFPDAFVEIQNPPRLGGKVGVAREDPAAVRPWADRIGIQPAPDRAAADRRHEPGALGFACQVVHAPPRKRTARAGGQFTGERLDGDDHLWGEKPGGDPGGHDPQDPPRVLRKSACARGTRPLAGCRDSGQSRHWTNRRPPTGSSWPGRPGNGVVYRQRLAASDPALPLASGQSDRDWFEASVRRDRSGAERRIFSISVQAENVSVFVK